MEKKVIQTDRAPAAVGPYVQAVEKGKILYLSGQLGLIPETGKLPSGVEEQARQSLKNIQAVLGAAGYGKEDVVKTTVYLTDMGDLAAVNEIYGAFFGEEKPARSCVGVSGLPKGGLVEIEAIALR